MCVLYDDAPEGGGGGMTMAITSQPATNHEANFGGHLRLFMCAIHFCSF